LGDVDDGFPYIPGDGTNTLRKCIRLANENADEPDTINFGLSGTISPTSPLPEIIDDETVIDASSQWIDEWPGGQPGITLDGIGAGVDVSGLRISGASNCHIRGLFITNFDDHGIEIGDGAQFNTIGGTTECERNIISGNGWNGLNICGSEANNNAISGNYIGTDINGTNALGNSMCGICIGCGAQSNTIGGTTEDKRNIISGNYLDGVLIMHSGTNNNKIIGNYIGTDANGTANQGNSRNGVCIVQGAQSNIIGDTTEGERNIISGNNQSGVDINGSGTDNNVTLGNYIGTDVSGTAPLGNLHCGVRIAEGAQSNIIGGSTEGERNIISGNDNHGVLIGNSGTNSNVVSGNYIGTDVSGTADLGNSGRGVFVTDGAQSNTIGGTTDGERNVISGNDEDGVNILEPGTNHNVVSGNYIGTDASGTADLGNSRIGVWIWDGAQSNTIGGTTVGERNIISGNEWSGVSITGSGANNNKVLGNYIGTDVNGTAALGNSGNGVSIGDGAQSNTIGGTTATERNVISGNGNPGVLISDLETNNNKVIGNYIGSDITGTVALGNGRCGVLIVGGAKWNTIGGVTAGEKNIIAGNDKGVVIGDSEADGNVVSGNYIGPEPPPKTGDVSGDKTISAYDAALILRYVVGLIDELPADSMVSPSAISPRSYIVEIPELSARVGDRIHVPIVINNATGLWAGGISLKYDRTILKAINVLTDITLNGSYWKANTELDGEVRFAFATTEPTKGQGNLLMVEFEVLPNTEGKTSRLMVDNVNLSNSLNVTKIDGSVTVIPSTFALLQNYPNPFNPDTWIPFELATDASVTINIYNAKGQLIRAIVLGSKAAGVYLSKDKAAYWDGRDDSGEKVSSGVYFYTLQTGEFTATRKLVVVK